MADQKATVQHPLQHKLDNIFSYLDLVKFKFNDQPQVFNDFCDIVMEFKSQSIDMLGLIQKITFLFKDHPELILGLNTFSPPGCKIEMCSNNSVNVSMPNLTNVVIMTSSSIAQPTAVTTSAIVTEPGVQQQPQPIVGNLPQNAFVFSASETANLNSLLTHPFNSQAFPNFLMPRNSVKALLVSLANNTALSQNSNVSDPNMPQPQLGLTLIELNAAVNYLNKVKNRFQTQPEVYKQFVDILQSYEKEQQINENECVGSKLFREIQMFAEVAKLLQHQEDLAQEFRQFFSDGIKSVSSTAPSRPNSN